MPPKRGKKRGPKKAAEIAKKISFDKNESDSDNNAESNQMDADAPILSESSSESEREEQSNQKKEEAHTVSNANMTVADVVRDASHRLIQLNKYASLALLKKMLISERDALWVGRNYKRMKAAIKGMFASAEIVPHNHSQSAKNHYINLMVLYKFEYAKKANTTTVEAKKNTKKAVGGKTAKPAQSKTGRTKNTKFVELPEFDDDEDVPVKYR